MRGNELRAPQVVQLHAHLPSVQTRACEHCRRGARREREQSARIADGFDAVQELEVSKVVHVRLVLERDGYAVPAQLQSAHATSERELANHARLVVVPDHNFVGRELRRRSSPDERLYVAPE